MRPGMLHLGIAAAISSALVGCRSPDQVGPRAAAPDVEHAKAARLLSSRTIPAEPVPVYIDGRRYVGANSSAAFNIIDPDRIASVRLVTGPEAEALADVDGRHGVIWITTKQAAENGH